jgi:hypothetical protein
MAGAPETAGQAIDDGLGATIRPGWDRHPRRSDQPDTHGAALVTAQRERLLGLIARCPEPIR